MIDEKKLIEERPEWLNPDCAGNEEYNKGWNACNKYWCNTIKQQPKVGEWIPCSERLPKIRQDCLVTVKYTGFMGMHGIWVKTGHMESENDWWGDCAGGEVIAWQPLPEPYDPGMVRKQTNADRIRNMDDEDLAMNMMCPNESGLAEIACDKSDNCNCYECILKWLQSEVEEQYGNEK